MSTAESQHGVPAIDRACDVLTALEHWPEGRTVRELVEETGLARATVYRTVRSLVDNKLVRQLPDGGYVLGPRLIALATRVPMVGEWINLAAQLRPSLRKLRDEIGESSKISILCDDRTLCIAWAPGLSLGALSGIEGQTYPLHAGAASKILLAHAPPTLREEVLRGPLERYTDTTITDRKALEAELEEVRRLGYAMDRCEFDPHVRAVAAPIAMEGQRAAGALSVAYLAERHAQSGEDLRRAVVNSAAEMTALLSRRPRPRGRL